MNNICSVLEHIGNGIWIIIVQFGSSGIYVLGKVHNFMCSALFLGTFEKDLSSI